jgi:streptogramin lyase
METRRYVRFVLATGMAVITLTVLLSGLKQGQSAFADPTLARPSQAAYSSFVFRFDPAGQTFYTYTLPAGSAVYNIGVTGTNPTHIWLADLSRNVIGHLVYTDANHVAWNEYPVTSTVDSGPFRLTLDGDFVWFTEQRANRIGRLDTTTGEIVEFYGHGLSTGSGLADVRVSPDGLVWVTGLASNQLIQLTVTSTLDYAFHEYTHTLMSKPFALAIEPDIPPGYNVWFTAPSGGYKVGRYTPGLDEFMFPQGFPSNSAPAEAVFGPGTMWFSDPGRNRIAQIEIGTFTIANLYGPITRPLGLAKESYNVLWTTLQNEQGGLARFVYTSPVSTRFDVFALPTAGLRPTGVAVAANTGVWLAAFRPSVVYLPIVTRN